MGAAEDMGGGCIVVGYLLLNAEELEPLVGPGTGGIALLEGGIRPGPGVWPGGAPGGGAWGCGGW